MRKYECGEPDFGKGTGMWKIQKLRTEFCAVLLIFMMTALAGCGRGEDLLLEEDAESSFASEIRLEPTVSGETAVSIAPEVTAEPQKIVVDVCGAVRNPGVYELEMGARIFQAVEAAGGYLPEAAQTYLNRARSLEDGQQIYVPTEDELVSESFEIQERAPEAAGEEEKTQTAEQPEDERVDLNTADVEQLTTLSGIGTSKAEAIIAYREAHGGFASIEELMNVEGIKEGTFSKIKDKISAG